MTHDKHIKTTLSVKRRGFTITEMLITTLLLGSVMATVAPLLRLSVQQRQKAEQQLIATEAANSLLELITSTPYTQINQQRANELLQQEDKSTTIRGAIWSVVVSEKSAEKSKSIAVAIQWKEKKLAPIHLTTWVYER